MEFLMRTNVVSYRLSRQSIWLEIRQHADDFTAKQIINFTKAKGNTTRGYIASLRKAGIIQEIYRENPKKGGTPILHYSLVKDTGYQAPSVNEKGEIYEVAAKQKAMWNTLRITQMSLTVSQLVIFSSTPEVEIFERTASVYISKLYLAGYLKKKGNKYQLYKHMNTGSKPPMLQKDRQVYDQNLNKVMVAKNELKSIN
jgi:hypothetical protein